MSMSLSTTTMAEILAPLEKLMSELFPILHQVMVAESYIDHIGSQDMDKLGDEIATALKRCSVPESEIDEKEKKFTIYTFTAVFDIYEHLKKRAQRSMNSHDGALLVLFQKTISTPVNNINALFNMCDPTIRTGSIRRDAAEMLYDLAKIDSIWKLQIPAGNSAGSMSPREAAPSSSSFGKKLIEKIINSIKTKQCFCGDCLSDQDDSRKSACLTRAWVQLCSNLPKSLDSIPANEVLDIFNTIQDWPRLLQSEGIMPTCKDRNRVDFYDVEVFVILHQWPCQLLANDPTNIKAKTFLRQQLGSCHELLRKVLCRIITEEIFPEKAYHDVNIRVNAMQMIIEFFESLYPVPCTCSSGS